MQSDQDQLVPYGALTYSDIHAASVAPGVTGSDIIGALLGRVMARHARALAGGDLVAVSGAFDVLGAAGGGALAFSSQLDRQTRSLVFVSGSVSEAGAPRLKATALYRIRSA